MQLHVQPHSPRMPHDHTPDTIKHSSPTPFPSSNWRTFASSAAAETARVAEPKAAASSGKVGSIDVARYVQDNFKRESGCIGGLHGGVTFKRLTTITLQLTADLPFPSLPSLPPKHSLQRRRLLPCGPH